MQPSMKIALPGFEGIKRYWDKQRDMTVAKILPGEFYISKQEEIIATVLGSCISACIWDTSSKIGGMNHFMLPEVNQDGAHGSNHWLGDNSYSCRYGNWAMEYLINELLKFGAKKKNLQAKIFGGGNIINATSSQVGNGNIEFVLEYLHNENIHIIANDTGGNNPRKVLFFPLSGAVKVKKLKSLHNDTIQRRENQYMHSIEDQETQGGDVELF